MIVVTGATGHIGNNLVRALVKRGHRVRCMVLPGESLVPLGGLDVEIVEGDVRDIESLYKAFDGAQLVFHLASIISLLPGNEKLLEEVNVKGARNVAEACLKTGVRRLVYTSTIHALVEPPIGQVIDESMPVDPERMSMAYSKSKARATLGVLEVIGKGLDAAIVMPTGVIGPYDFRPSATGQMLLDYAAGKIPVRIDGGYDFVDVRDVAQGHILVAEKGRTGERYILSGEWISVDEILQEVSKATRAPFPRWKIPAAVASAAAYLVTSYCMLTGAKLLINRDTVSTLRGNSLISSEKARRELGYTSRPIRETIRDTLEWFRGRGLLKTW
ncbi:MAG: SDR family oxidoreductase [Bacillota bacterium]|jgi:dihydroflavonol-4-reductase|nr:SDR family oxidoreductase [Candidatus Fermentithermobacillaceae bacterium]